MGITGLNCAYQLSSNNNIKILLLDEIKYLGGRVLTYYNKNYNYELGAGRFNNNHKKLIKLINRFKLNKNKINNNINLINHELKKILKIIIPDPIKLNSYYWIN